MLFQKIANIHHNQPKWKVEYTSSMYGQYKTHAFSVLAQKMM